MGVGPSVVSFLQQFMRLYAHGMKNRLTPAVTALYMLEEDPAAAPERILNLASMMMRSHQSALALLSSLDNMSEIMPEAPKTIDWAELLRSMAGGMGLTIAVEPAAGELTLDVALWTVIARELLANVRDHGGRQGRLVWTVTGNRLRIELTDEGPGLKTMAPDRALEATRRSEQSPGVGMGLSKALYAAVLMNGSLELVKLPQGVLAVAEADLVSQSS